MTALTLPPISKASGTVEPPGSKSISNRVLPLAALASGITTIKNLPDGEDVELMQSSLKQLGLKLSENQGAIKIEGLGEGFSSEKPIDLFLGNSGTSMRTLAALICASEGHFNLDGIARMRERPIADLIDAILPIAGNTTVTYTGQRGFPPLKIFAQGLDGGKTKIRGNVSSQFLTGLLLAMPLCKGRIEVEMDGPLSSMPYVALTLQMMETFGVKIENDNFRRFILENPQGYRSPGEYIVEPDASSASYFLAAGAIAGKVQVKGLPRPSLQGEARFSEVLETMGAKVDIGDQAITVSKNPTKKLQGIDVDMDSMSDTGMTLAMVALFAEGPTTIRNIASWRVKETDRIAAMAKELRKVGAEAEEGPDWLKIYPPKKFLAAEIETYNDHRMAMCFSLTCFGGVPVTLRDPGCTRKTYPNYFEDFNKILVGQKSL